MKRTIFVAVVATVPQMAFATPSKLHLLEARTLSFAPLYRRSAKLLLGPDLRSLAHSSGTRVIYFPAARVSILRRLAASTCEGFWPATRHRHAQK